MEPIPLVPPKRGRRSLFRPLLLVALVGALVFTQTGKAVLAEIKEAIVGVTDTSAPQAALGSIDAADALKTRPAPADASAQPPEPAASGAQSAGSIDAAVPVPEAPAVDPQAEAERIAKEAAAAAAAAEAQAREKDAADFARRTAPSPQVQALQQRVSANGTGLSEHLAVQARTQAASSAARRLPWSGALQLPAEGQKASPYAGLWEGAFDGRTEGEVALYVQPDGTYRGTVAIERRSRLFTVTGAIAPNGQLLPSANPFFGPLGLFEMQGRLLTDQAASYGYWSPGALQEGGTWLLRRR